MTVGEMRELMRRRVVPENLVPQNIIGLLMDDEENAAPPELDAFTFLTRLRGLGIGSADFLYLMEGCGAPQTVVDKLKNNPAMSLQGLILTLENSELTADDYSRILYTARQIWERTLTLRLEKSEMVSGGENDDEEDYYEPTFEEVMEELGHMGEDDESDEGDDISGYDEFREAFVTEELAPPISVSGAVESPIEESAEEVVPEEAVEEAADEDVIEEAAAEDIEEPMTSAEDIVNEETEAIEEPSEEYVSQENAESFAAPKAEFTVEIPTEQEVYTEEIEPVADQPYNGETTAIIQIDQEMLRRNLELLAEEEAEEVRAEAARIAAEQAQEHARAAYEAARADEDERKGKKKNKRSDEFDDDIDDIDDEPDDDDIDEEEEEEEEELRERRAKKRDPFVISIPKEHPYHKGAIVTAAVGAVVVFGTAVGVRFIPEPTVIKSISYAEDDTAIFNDIYYSYYDNIVGGEKACTPVFDYNKIFGDLLVTADGYGTFTSGDNIYTVTAEAVSAKVFVNGSLTELDEILPPDGTRIVDVFDDKDAIVAVFNGDNECGFMRISGGTELFTVRQDGFITDLDYNDGDILIGSVYTPRFTRTFGVQDHDVYMPRLGVGDKTALEPQKVIPSGTRGYSYGISAKYSAQSGAVNSAVAVLGDPVSSSADGRFIMSGEEEDLLITAGEEITAVKAAGIQKAAFYEYGCATYEGGNVNLRGMDGAVTAQLANPARIISSMWFEGDMLRLSADDGVFLTADCSKINEPRVIELKTVSGAVYGDNALICGIGANAVMLSHYKLENGAANLVNTFTKAFSAEQLSTVEFGGINTIVADGVRFGAAYRYFDGVSVMSEYAVMDDVGQSYPTKELFDDRTGFTLAFKHGGNIYALCGGGIVDILN